MTILYYLAMLGSLACYVMVLIKMFPAEGPLKGILGIICGLYTYVWGWMNSSRFNLKTIMLAWTGLIILQIALGAVVGMSMASGLSSGM
jgi:hypothetical protein